MAIKKIGVIGAGTMGSGISQVCASAGFDVLMIDVSDAALQRGLATIDNSLSRQVKKEKITEGNKRDTLARIQPTTDYALLADRDIVIESATENETLKLKILQQVDSQIKEDAIIVTNTSSISITKLASATTRPERFMGFHFFNPVPMMELVELIRGIGTDDACFATAYAFAEALGKRPVAVKNAPGFVVNRILCPMINEAIFAFQEGLATAEQIDTAMKLGTNMPLGPLELADVIGLDTMLKIMETFYHGFDDPKYRPALLLKEMVDAGYLGRKTGRGFYTYG